MNDNVRRALESCMQAEPPVTDRDAQIRASRDWACAELYFRLGEHPLEDPEDILFGFATEMYHYYSITPKTERFSRQAFRVCYETAMDILRMIQYPHED